MEQLVEGRGSPACLKVLLDYVQLFSRKDVASQKLPSQIPTTGIFRKGFFHVSFNSLKLCLNFARADLNPARSVGEKRGENVSDCFG
jgi:hypothetical protein